ncbi:UDP-N-acetylmuramate--L-alanine ligase [Venenivibrio stagnispumantis]|uniref:UDP-N-acetylmuramate--L-alanine ligase n=1 Tax=Venenivibrio stagnispumantis TaxID=407998 RepID=A0AA45WK49_9AQUI|nr:UDP-N-acetylmuramate--L-alanine ligase [Venenivibrio stagnispumantis]MCW4572985.1 UDP-N-acetylmuramate--L-alanine ligase [Venenivibrio stagnispumantis]SMP05580.1 UDP-N-acetylmuramate--L-alanine ligase [Venenivibrio stagnispumantis]
MFRGKVKKIHFIGIGGSGMNGIAQVLLNQGFIISGSDLKETETVLKLKEMGAKIFIGHNPENVVDTDLVVYSSAVTPDNPELQKAKELGIPTIPRGEMLAELMRFKYGIAIAGSHGKTTTTSMVGTILGKTGFDPTVVIGGKLEAYGSNAKLGRGEFIVTESDESDGSFLRLTPTIVSINNIDLEHIGFYKDLEDIKNAFIQFANKVPFYGAVAVNIDDENVRSILPRIEKKVIKFGLSDEAQIKAENIELIDGRYKFHIKGYGDIHLSIPGKHNIYNALAAISISLELGVPFCVIKEALENFKNANRRFDIKYKDENIIVVDDYAHHPTEIKATLSAAKDMYPDKRIIAVFQPHRYSRVASLFEEFAKSFDIPDVLILTDIYSAGEKPIEGITGEALAEKIKERKKEVIFVKDIKEAENLIKNIMKNGDLIITLGAGNITTISDNLSKFLRERC